MIIVYLRPDCLDAGEEQVVMEGEGAAYLRYNQPEDREPPESVHCAHLIMIIMTLILIIIMMTLTFDMEYPRPRARMSPNTLILESPS